MKYALKEWRTELAKRFGDDMLNWKFVCPACGRITSVSEFKEAGAEPNDSYQCCIGRFTKDKGCDWAAFGFLGTLGKGDIVVTEDGKEVGVFAMAEDEK